MMGESGDQPSRQVALPYAAPAALQTAADFRLELQPDDFVNIPKEFNMRPHTDGSQSAYSFSHGQQGGPVSEYSCRHVLPFEGEKDDVCL